MKLLSFKLLLLYQLIKQYLFYNDSIPFNWTKTPQYCYVEDFILSNNYRPLVDDIYPLRGCSSDERNKNYATNYGITNITFQPKLDFFFNKDTYPPVEEDELQSYMTFKLNFPCTMQELIFNKNREYSYRIYFGRSDDYQAIPKISKRTGKQIVFNENKAILNARIKYYKNELQDNIKGNVVVNFTSKNFDFYEYEGEDLNVTFDGYELDFQLYNVFEYNERRTIDNSYCEKSSDYYALLIRVYDLPRMKVQGLFQYKGILLKTADNSPYYNNIYTVDTRNIFFQNISMFYNQRVNVSFEGNDPTGEDSGFWINTPCNKPQMATIMVDYFFFDTIHRMQKYGYEFSDRFQLRIHTPYYRKTLTKSYSLFRSQWNESYEKPRVFIHPIHKYKERYDQNPIYPKFNFTEWSTDPQWTQYIIDINNEIVGNEIRINFSELEKIYKADGFNRSKLVINVNNTMTPHITQSINGLWAELYDTVTNDWVMKTKTTMDEVHGYLNNNEADPYRNFYLTCEIPDNITNDDIEFVIKKYGILQTAHLWFRLDVFNKGITKMYPPRFNVVFKFPPEIMVTKDTFGYTYKYYISGDDNKMFSEIGEDEFISNTTFNYIDNTINVSELHPNFPNGDDTLFYTQTQNLCTYDQKLKKNCIDIEIKRQFLYYFYDLSIAFNKNGTRPIDITIYQIKYIPYHSKEQINRGLHRWNPHHAGWAVPTNAIFSDTKNNNLKYYGYYYEPNIDNFYFKPDNSDEYINIRGPSNAIAYNGPDCVFNFAGGSTMKNNSCEFWSGIIADKPFTNYARDIYEEHIAYRTLNDDNTLTIDTRIDGRAEYINYVVLDPYPGKFTSLCFEVIYWNEPTNADKDGEPLCKEFSKTPKGCENCSDYYKPIYNVNKNTKEFFVKIKLPNGFSVNSTCIGKILPCNWSNREFSQFNYYSLQDYLCYYVNNTHIYAFNSMEQIGVCPNSLNYDIILQVDGIYIYENITKIEKESGIIKFGFYESTFFVAEYPRYKDEPLFFNQNVSVEINRSNMTNDIVDIFTFNILAKDSFLKDNVFRIDFPGEIKNAELKTISYNGDYNEEQNNNLKNQNGFIINGEQFDKYWEYMNLPIGKEVGNSFIIAPYLIYHNEHPEPSNYSLINKNESMKFEINITVENYRSIKPLIAHFYMTNLTFNTIFQHEFIEFKNTIPQYLQNLKVSSNSYYTNDRAIYTFNFITYLKEIYKGEIFEFKTSWRASFKNKKDSNEKDYFINKITFDRNYSISGDYLNISIYGNPILNPDNLEEQYIKDIKILDKEGYILAIYDKIIPIKMEKIIGFKSSEVNTKASQTGINLGKFDIKFELVPEILIKKNDLLKLKFSSAVLLKNYNDDFYVDIEKGLNDDNFTYEINTQNNELIFFKGVFTDIGESEFIFDNKNSSALVDQEIIFTLKNISITQSHSNALKKIFSVDIRIESNNGAIIQQTKLPSSANFECGYKCKTCENNNINLCLSCVDEYPIYDKEKKECHKNCPNENYYIKNDEEGNKICALCEEPCERCEEEGNHCTKCIDPLFLENNNCVMNCSEGFAPDPILRYCYKVNYINQTRNIEKIVYVNITVPEPYPVYIQKNVCLKYNETI